MIFNTFLSISSKSKQFLPSNNNGVLTNPLNLFKSIALNSSHSVTITVTSAASKHSSREVVYTMLLGKIALAFSIAIGWYA